MYSIKLNKYADELFKLDFKNLFCNPEDPEIWLNHCKQYNMKFLKGSYGTVVHSDFDKYFKKVNSMKIYDKLTCKNDNKDFYLPLDHINILKSKVFDKIYIVTSSPNSSMLNLENINDLCNYPYNIYIINPNFLDYYGHIDGIFRNPLYNPNYAFTDAEEDIIRNINHMIYENTGIFGVFEKLI